MAKKTAKPESKVTFVRLRLDVHDKAVSMAARDNRTISNMIAVLLQEAIEARAQ